MKWIWLRDSKIYFDGTYNNFLFSISIIEHVVSVVKF